MVRSPSGSTSLHLARIAGAALRDAHVEGADAEQERRSRRRRGGALAQADSAGSARISPNGSSIAAPSAPRVAAMMFIAGAPILVAT